jgi:hypothetical protein
VEPGRQLVSCAFRIGEQVREHAAMLLVLHSVAAPLDLAGSVRRAGRANSVIETQDTPRHESIAAGVLPAAY